MAKERFVYIVVLGLHSWACYIVVNVGVVLASSGSPGVRPFGGSVLESVDKRVRSSCGKSFRRRPRGRLTGLLWRLVLFSRLLIASLRDNRRCEAVLGGTEFF